MAAIPVAIAIPGLGEFIVAGLVVTTIAGVVVKAGSEIYNNVMLAKEKEIEDVRSKIPSRLKKPNGDVDLGKFTENVRGRNAKKEKGGWEVEKDYAGHGGKTKKIKDPKGNRVGSLDDNGKILSK